MNIPQEFLPPGTPEGGVGHVLPHVMPPLQPRLTRAAAAAAGAAPQGANGIPPTVLFAGRTVAREKSRGQHTRGATKVSRELFGSDSG